MNQSLINQLCLCGVIFCAAIGSAMGQTDAPAKLAGTSDSVSTQQPPPTAAEAAIQRAADANKYVFVFFFRADDDATKVARATLDAAMPKFSERATSVTVGILDSHEKALVKKYELDRAPMPLVLALAPNGAVTRSFPLKFTEAQLETAFVSPGMQKCLKALQDRKLVFLCVQNDKTQYNADARMGVKDFAADDENAKTTEIITIDPADPAEEALLKQFKVDPKTDEAVTVFLAPPGTTIGTYKGATMKGVLKAAAKNAAKGCDPKSGCCAPPAKS